MKKGLLITLEGFECVGKTTALRIIEEMFKERGLNARPTREPGGTPVGEELRDYLFKNANRMEPTTETLLFYASRLELTAKLLLPTLEAGDSVVCDRYYDSTLAYQGALGNDFPKEINKFLIDTDRLLIPDFTLYFDASYETSMRRKHGRGTVKGEEINAFEDERDEQWHRQIIENFRAIAEEHKDRVIKINAEQSQSAVMDNVRHVVGTILDNHYS